MRDLILNSSLTHSLLLFLPVVCALALRLLRCPGWSVFGGVIAGFVLGPALLGRVAPDAFERHFVGAVAEREARDAIVRRQEADRVAAGATGLDDQAWADLLEHHRIERSDAVESYHEAKWQFQRPFRSFTAAVAAITLFGAGLMRITRGSRRQQFLSPLSIGIWAAALPGGVAIACALRGWHVSWPAAIATGAAVAIGPWILPVVDQQAADEAEFGGARMIQTAGRVASVLAIILAAGALIADRGANYIWAVPLAAIPLSWLVPALPHDPATARRVVRTIMECAFVPSLAACAMLRIEVFAHFSFWPALVLLLLSGDGRWTGALLGALLPGGRHALRSMRLVMGASACGPTQLAITALAVHTWVIPERLALGLIIGALMIELTTPMRRRVAERLAETERELEELEER